MQHTRLLLAAKNSHGKDREYVLCCGEFSQILGARDIRVLCPRCGVRSSTKKEKN
jgi:hypothetical protein